jgi:hypothetical protein
MVSTLTAVLITLGSFAASAISTDATTDTWQGDYTKALAATRQDDRPLLVVLDVPSDPKAAVETEQFEIEGEQGKLLESYQLCHVDASTKYGKKVADAFRATQFPFTAIIDKTGSVVLLKKSGQVSNDEWQETLAKYQKGEQSTKTYTTSYYRGSAESSKTVTPSGCTSCQLKVARQAKQAAEAKAAEKE